MKLLITVDGSEPSSRAVRHVISRLAGYAAQGAVEVHVLNVQPPLRGNVGMFLDRENLDDYHREEGMKALQPARALLDAAGVKHEVHIEVGRPGEVIDRHARERGVDEIVMGSRGLGNVADILLGSTSEDVLRLTATPVLLVK